MEAKMSPKDAIGQPRGSGLILTVEVAKGGRSEKDHVGVIFKQSGGAEQIVLETTGW